MDDYRGRWEVPTNSFHWALYLRWRELGGEGPMTEGRPIDLCHYMRVVMIWVWFRKFFLGGWDLDDLPVMPWMIALVSGIITAIAYLCATFGTAVQILEVVGFVIGIIAVGVGAGLGLAMWAEKSPESFKTFWRRVAKPFIPIGHGLEWFAAMMFVGCEIAAKHVARSATATFRFLYPHLERVIYWRIKVMHFLVLIPLALPWAFDHTAAFWLDISVLCLAALIVILVAGALGVEWLYTNHLDAWFAARKASRKAKRRLRALERFDETRSPAVKKGPSKLRQFAKLMWMWMTAKKHRICPLIIPRAGD